MTSGDATGSGSALEPVPASRRWSWTTLLLIASLALNLLVLGALAHRAMDWRRGGHDAMAGPAMRFLRELPAERRAVLEPQVEAVRAALRQGRQGLKDAHKKAQEFLIQEPFDRLAFEATLRQFMDGEGSGRGAAIGPIVNLVEAMTPAERLALSKRIRKFRFGGPPGP